jgi:hypothetical protein
MTDDPYLARVSSARRSARAPEPPVLPEQVAVESRRGRHRGDAAVTPGQPASIGRGESWGPGHGGQLGRRPLASVGRGQLWVPGQAVANRLQSLSREDVVAEIAPNRTVRRLLGSRDDEVMPGRPVAGRGFGVICDDLAVPRPVPRLIRASSRRGLTNSSQNTEKSGPADPAAPTAGPPRRVSGRRWVATAALNTTKDAPPRATRGLPDDAHVATIALTESQSPDQAASTRPACSPAWEVIDSQGDGRTPVDP